MATSRQKPRRKQEPDTARRGRKRGLEVWISRGRERGQKQGTPGRGGRDGRQEADAEDKPEKERGGPAARTEPMPRKRPRNPGGDGGDSSARKRVRSNRKRGCKRNRTSGQGGPLERRLKQRRLDSWLLGGTEGTNRTAVSSLGWVAGGRRGGTGGREARDATEG